MVRGTSSTEDAARRPTRAPASAVAPRSHARRRIRVAFCIDNMEIGGTELNAVRTAERLDRSRFDLCVVSLRDYGPLLARYRDHGIPVHCFPLRRLHGLGAFRQGIRLARF